MATLGDGFKGIFLAGIGAVAIGAEKGKELVDQLVARGEMTVEQGKQINTELKHRASNLEWTTCSDNHRHSYRDLDRKKHALTRKTVLSNESERLVFESCLLAANHLGVRPGSVASAATRGHLCCGYGVSYE